MSNKKENRFPSFRSLFLRVFPLLAVLLIDVFFLAMLNTLFFNKKKSLIIDAQNGFYEPLKIVNPLQVEAINPARDYLNNLRDAYRSDEPRYLAAAKDYLEKTAPALLEDSTHPWYRMVLTDKNNRVVFDYQNPKKLRTFNTWNNCLFSRSFDAPMALFNLHFTVYYTTPPDLRLVENLVVHYRWYAALFVLGTWVVYFWLSRNVFSPLHRIGRAIERMIQSEHVALIAPPRHEIERAFNRLARNQREIYFSLEVDHRVDALHALSDDTEVLHQFIKKVIEPIRRLYPCRKAQSYRWSEEEGRFELLGAAAEADRTVEIPPPAGEEPFVLNGSGIVIYLRAGDRTVGALWCEADLRLLPDREELSLMALEIKKQAENGIARALTRSRTLTEERNRFGINLATNMGHDLTNIIASGKWDLDTIQRAHRLGIVTMDPQRGSFFLEAVKGLRNNLHFLQEMVNIYRSFGYTRRPRYEPTDITALIRDVTELFRLSISQKLSMKTVIDGNLTAVIEPRLLRMALFNLFANASQAIQQSREPVPNGTITVTASETGDRLVSLTVYDNGPGIRDREGHLLREPEINRIFQAGYSTKEGSLGSGLGLSWVKSIVEDFHGGSIRAVNRPEGGACFIIQMPMQDPSSSTNP